MSSVTTLRFVSRNVAPERALWKPITTRNPVRKDTHNKEHDMQAFMIEQDYLGLYCVY